MTLRRLRTRRAVGPPQIPAGLWSFLIDAPYVPSDENDGRLQIFLREPAELWLEHRATVIGWYATNKPGRRPSLYWEHEVLPPRRRGESDAAFLRRHGLLLPGEDD
jgi:hypothetical protein